MCAETVFRSLGAERYLPARRSTQPQRPNRRRLPLDPSDDAPHVIFKFEYASRGSSLWFYLQNHVDSAVGALPHPDGLHPVIPCLTWCCAFHSC